MHNKFEDIFQVTRLIPFGRITSYGLIAQYIGSQRGARLVGWALNSSHTDETIPAHRVVNRKGILSGKHHFSGKTMQELLENEGHEIENNQIKDFQQKLWNPTLELL